MSVEVLRVVYSPSQDSGQSIDQAREQAAENQTPAESHVDEAVGVVGMNAAEKSAREQARLESNMAAYAESIAAHEFNMDRVMDLLNDAAMTDLD